MNPQTPFLVERFLGPEKYFSLPALAESTGTNLARLPYALKILLENLLRHQDSPAVERSQIEAVMNWQPHADRQQELAFHPARVVLQDFTGVPAVVDLSAMRDAVAVLGGDPNEINPLFPVELVIDHSVQVDSYGEIVSLRRNRDHEYERNEERYKLLRWAQGSFSNFQVVPPATGIVHQVNLERLARGVFQKDGVLYPDTLVGTDSHTTMINGIGVLGWGVGGIEAEAAMLGQPINLLIPDVIGVRLYGAPPVGTTATDLVLTLTELLRKVGVVGKFVEFFGVGLENVGPETRATIANMSPEFGSTCALFPVDDATLRYMALTGRSDEAVARVRDYFTAQGLFRTSQTEGAEYTRVVEFDLSSVQACLSGPTRPQDRVILDDAKGAWQKTLAEMKGGNTAYADVPATSGDHGLRHGDVVIAAITSCTNTSNPHVMFAAALLARAARARGLSIKPWVKTSLAPGSKVVTRYLTESGLMDALEELRFHVVGYGCTTCIGNSGPLEEPITKAIQDRDLVVVSVLSGNRNFEGRINPHVRANYLASPPLVVAYALAGTMNIDFQRDPLGQDPGGNDVFLRDLWPREQEISALIEKWVRPESFSLEYASVFDGDEIWKALPTPKGSRYEWEQSSTYIQKPPFFEGITPRPIPLTDIEGARALLVLGDSVTTDHISPAGNIGERTAAGRYLIEQGVLPHQFNSYGARRGNHQVMMRGTFANVRIKNQLVKGVEGGFSRHLPEGEPEMVFDVAQKYQAEGTPLVVLAGKEYGSGSSRDWAAKGTLLLGVRAVLAESYERIHRSNLVGMGVLPLEYLEGESAASLGLTGEELFSIRGIESGLRPGMSVPILAVSEDGSAKEFRASVRIDTRVELSYYEHGGILNYVLRRLALG